MKITLVLLLSLVLGGCVGAFADRSKDIMVDGFRIGIDASRPPLIRAYYVSSEKYDRWRGVPAPVFMDAATKAIEIYSGCKVSSIKHHALGGESTVDATVKCPRE